MLIPWRRARALAWVAAFAACGCDNEVTPLTGGSGGGATTSTTAASTGTSIGTPGDGATIAITELRLGTESVTAWQKLGVDIDGVDSAAENLAEHCKPNQNASAKNVFPDAPGGIDNSFGKNLLPVFKSISGSTDFEVAANGPIKMGRSTLLLDLTDLGTGATQAPVTLRGLSGTNHTANQWDIAPESLSGATPDTTKMTFPAATLTGNTLAAGGGTLLLNVGVSGTLAMHLTLRAATVRAALSADHASISNGILAGVLDTEEFAAEFKRVMGAFSPDLCEGQAVESVLNQIRQASDIRNDGTNGAAGTCNGISIGIGFDGALTSLGPVAGATPPDPDPCAN